MGELRLEVVDESKGKLREQRGQDGLVLCTLKRVRRSSQTGVDRITARPPIDQAESEKNMRRPCGIHPTVVLIQRVGGSHGTPLGVSGNTEDAHSGTEVDERI